MAASIGMLLAVLANSPAFAQLRVVTYNIAALKGNQTALQNVIAAIHADDKPGFAVPIAVIIFQEVQNADFPVLQSIMNAAAPPGVTYAAGTYTNFSEDGFAGAQALFFRSDLLNENTTAHADISTGAGRFADRWNIRLNGYLSPLASFYTYSSHLKAENTPADEATRLAGVQAIRTNANALASTAHIIYAGDQNFYDNLETGYLHYLSVGNGQAVDLLGTGSWAGGTQANNLKHSQSPLLTAANGLVGGGMNDRFDFQLITNDFNDGAGLSYIANTYRTLGNDGLHFNAAINSGNNFYYPGNLPRSNALAANLVIASDHVPLIVDYQIPAVMSATIDTDYGRVIQGAIVSLPVQVMNIADVDFAIGADELVYAATASGALSGVANDTVLALGDVSEPAFALSTSTVGMQNGSVQLTSTSQAVHGAPQTLNTTGRVVRHANASLDGASDLDQLIVPLEIESGTGVHFISIDVHNFGFDADQALLDVDSAGAVATPFAFVGGLEAGIGASPATLTFSIDGDGLKDGRYNANISVGTSDEDIPGETSANLQLTLAVTVGDVTPCPADVNGDEAVNITDLLAVIAAWGQPGGPADVNGDNVVNIADLLAVIAAWGLCP